MKVGPEQDKVMRGALSDGLEGAQDDPDQDLTMTKCTKLDRHPPMTLTGLTEREIQGQFINNANDVLSAGFNQSSRIAKKKDICGMPILGVTGSMPGKKYENNHILRIVESLDGQGRCCKDEKNKELIDHMAKETL